MKSYDKNKESSYIQCLDANNLYGWTISQNFPVMVLSGLNIHQVLIKNFKNL